MHTSKNWRLGEVFIVDTEEDGDHKAEVICFDDIKEAIAKLWVEDAREFETRSYKTYMGHYTFVIEYITTDDYDYEYIDEEKIFDIEKLKDFYINNPKCADLDVYFVDYDDLKDINAD